MATNTSPKNKAGIRPAIQRKIDKVKEVAAKLRSGKNFSLLDLRTLPSNLLQKIRKQLRDKGDVFVLQKAVFERVVKESPKLKQFAGFADKNVALIISEFSPVQLADMLRAGGVRVFAKAHQIAPYDIDVEESETSLPPGPALSDLKGVGITAQVKGGKIAITKKSTVVKSGAKISSQAVKVLRMLEIKPFSLFGKLLVGVDDGGLYYTADVLSTPLSYYVDGIRLAASQASALAINANYLNGSSASWFLRLGITQAQSLALKAGMITDDSVKFLLSGAIASGSALGGKVPESKEKAA